MIPSAAPLAWKAASRRNEKEAGNDPLNRGIGPGDAGRPQVRYCPPPARQALSRLRQAAGHGPSRASGLAPENTLVAFQKALELGVDGIITDYPDRLVEVMKEMGCR